ncbi:hypothetical protein NEMIN01_0856 [Nematocida minor]|uniref:uncharacterized protein n=1 Tax=Nematocida minor TaxID=1912983 RepID=UPI0022212A30|nr:uncharacterized protein NEMIN01_0856 [Nematocida minor]KAI5190071.1 hypothetical protein NEMIN01_0856 [Nematocida minor]
MSCSARVFILEGFGDVCSKIGYYLLNNRDVGLVSIYKNTQLSRKDVIKGLSLLIHFQIVGFANYSGKGTRYFIKNGYSSLNSYPVYIDYAERTYGPFGGQIATEILVRGRIGMNSFPSEMLECARKMIKDGVLSEESLSGVKRVKDESEKYIVFSKRNANAKILSELFNNDITKRFSENTKKVFLAVKSFYPAPSSFVKVLERCKEFGVQAEEYGETSIDAVVQKNLKYLIGYGALSGGYEMYQVNHESYLDKIKKEIALEYCDMFMGPNASTILSMLLSKGYVEDKFVQKYLLMEPSECKKTLFALLADRLISMQMISRTADCAPSKSFHLWSANIRKLLPIVEKKVQEKLNSSYIDLTTLQENKMFIVPSEYKHKTDLIYGVLERLHVFCFVLGL